MYVKNKISSTDSLNLMNLSYPAPLPFIGSNSLNSAPGNPNKKVSGDFGSFPFNIETFNEEWNLHPGTVLSEYY